MSPACMIVMFGDSALVPEFSEADHYEFVVNTTGTSYKQVYFCLAQSHDSKDTDYDTNQAVTIDWGDGAIDHLDSSTAGIQHRYSSVGTYVINAQSESLTPSLTCKSLNCSGVKIKTVHLQRGARIATPYSLGVFDIVNFDSKWMTGGGFRFSSVCGMFLNNLNIEQVVFRGYDFFSSSFGTNSYLSETFSGAKNIKSIKFVDCDFSNCITLYQARTSSSNFCSSLFYNCHLLGDSFFARLDSWFLKCIAISSRAMSGTGITKIPDAMRDVDKFGSNEFQGCEKLKTIGFSLSGKSIGAGCFKDTGLTGDAVYLAVSELKLSAAAVYSTFDRHPEVIIDHYVSKGTWAMACGVALFTVKKVKLSLSTAVLTWGFGSHLSEGVKSVEEIEISYSSESLSFYCRSLALIPNGYSNSVKKITVKANTYAAATNLSSLPEIEEIDFKLLTMSGVRNIRQSSSNTTLNFPFGLREQAIFRCTDGDIKCIDGIWTDFPSGQ